MVHLVRKKIGTKIYLYLQKSFHVKETGKKKTKHVKYLGREDKYTKEEIEQILAQYNERERGAE